MKTIQQPPPPVHIGIDVSKATLQVDLQGNSRSFPNTKAGHQAILKALPPGAFVVLEATGSYHLALVGSLQSSGIPVTVANPARVRQFARARGTLAKTDPVDAALLSVFGAAFTPPPTPPADPQRLLLKELVNLRDALVSEIIHWNNLREHQQAATVRKLTAGGSAVPKRLLPPSNKRSASFSRTPPPSAPWPASFRNAPEWGRLPERFSSPKCPSWGSSAAARRQPWPASPPMPTTAAGTKANA